MTDTPQLSEVHFRPIDQTRLFRTGIAHPMRRASFCFMDRFGPARSADLMTEEAARVLKRLGAETRSFNPSGLPLPTMPSGPSKGSGIARPCDVERRHGLVFARTARGDDRNHEVTDRLDPSVDWRRAADPRQDRWR